MDNIDFKLKLDDDEKSSDKKEEKSEKSKEFNKFGGEL